ncbi:3-hydroxybutyryl-CoA dehydrogenase [Azospirillum sp. 412522]|nr:3-hydroxybutyryl-CoA dehydrogenase [Azospirillum sp. 412522]MBY6262081.1 3-hydroxybutyryl-CoA dehydrogenase [Azospirillum sp. 412522]
MVTIRTVGIVGAGRMGSGIAYACAQSGLDVVLCDTSEDALAEAITVIAETLDRSVRKGLLHAADKAAALARISTGTDLPVVADADLVIEAVTENEQVKRGIFRALAQHLKAESLIVTNTSSMSVTHLAASTDRPSKFMGMHFMNPVPAMPLVELIRGIATDEETFAAISDLTTRIGKTAAVAEDFPAFIVHRVLLPMINEAVYTLYEGVGSVKDIDTALKLGANHPMGPLELADFIGLDTCLGIMQVLYEGLADSKYRPCPLLVKYVEAGWIGRKVGRGFYDYSHNPPIPSR